MKKYNYIVAISLLCCANSVQADAGERIKNKAIETVYSSAVHAQAASFIFYTDKKLAGRYVTFNQFYAKKADRGWHDILIDHVAYPVADHVVGVGMTQLNEIKAIHKITHTDEISHKNKEFIAHHLKLVLTAGAVTAARNAYEEERVIDEKMFGKACGAHIGCAIAKEYVVDPVIKSFVGDNDSLTATALSFLGNYVLANIVISQMDKK